ncbi:hypothetical protein [Mucilaginibacter sp. dw_454]|uniref:hypothetical protein n=1 Tax=Mucilaginibacter sp. dw_454 TaxID=2720079 RepID=UPI001BD63F7B|nr:hypothetical protein [Mucilaginibacter sp. dw_454]
MRKLFACLVFVISALVLLVAMNQSFINRVKQDRYFDHLNTGKRDNSVYHRLFIRSDRWRYGDLYGLSYLHQYKYQLEPFHQYTSRETGAANNRVLYIVGDSFLADKRLKKAFSDFDEVIFLDRRFPYGPIVPDTTKKNYLVMEFAERNLVGYDLQTTETTWSADDIKQHKNFDALAAKQSPPGLPHGLERISGLIFNKDLSRNLELLLFDDRLFTPVKEFKAAINYCFGRVAPEVAVSTDKKRLFLNMTVDTTQPESAFKPHTDNDIAQINQKLAAADSYYQSIGFKGVFLSIIPNAVSVYDRNRMTYNNLLTRVETKTTVPVISIDSAFRQDHRNLFYKSDAHWNPAGFDEWVGLTDSYFKTHLN